MPIVFSCNLQPFGAVFRHEENYISKSHESNPDQLMDDLFVIYDQNGYWHFSSHDI